MNPPGLSVIWERHAKGEHVSVPSVTALDVAPWQRCAAPQVYEVLTQRGTSVKGHEPVKEGELV